MHAALKFLYPGCHSFCHCSLLLLCRAVRLLKRDRQPCLWAWQRCWLPCRLQHMSQYQVVHTSGLRSLGTAVSCHFVAVSLTPELARGMPGPGRLPQSSIGPYPPLHLFMMKPPSSSNTRLLSAACLVEASRPSRRRRICTRGTLLSNVSAEDTVMLSTHLQGGWWLPACELLDQTQQAGYNLGCTR